MELVPYGLTVRRGYAERRHQALALVAGAGLVGEPVDDVGPGPSLAAGLRADLEPLTLLARARWGAHGAEGEDIHLRHRVLGADAEVAKLYDVGAVSIGLGLRLGLEQVAQRFETAGSAPARTALVGRGGPTARLEYAPHARWLTGLVASVDGLLLPGDDQLTTEIAPHVGLEASFYLR